MWRRRMAMAAVLASVASIGAVGALTPAARAGGPGDPIEGDLNGDGIPDVAILAVAPPAVRMARGGAKAHQCEVVVNFGLPTGGHLPPAHRPFMTVDTPAHCPDLGAALNLDGDPQEELVASWFIGTPPIVAQDLMVLDDFQIRNVVDGIDQPSYIGTDDFNGDDREDVYEWTDQGDGFITLMSEDNGGLSVGEIRWCAGNRPDFQLSQFDRRAGTDVVLAYVEGCGAYFSGVVVLFADGREVHLQRSVLGDESWTVEARDVNGDNWPDIGTTAQSTGAVDWFISVGDGQFVRAHRAVQDKPVVSATRRTNIRVLDNDFATTEARISIVEPPLYGRVQVTSSRTVVYTPNPRHGRTDRFVYRLTGGGGSSNASVNLRLR